MVEQIKNFQEMGNIIKGPQKNEKNQKDKELKKRFQEVVGNRVDNVPPGCQFISDLENIDSISIIKQQGNKGLYVIPYYKDQKGKIKHETFSVFPDGTFSGSIPKGLKVSREQIYEEVLDNLDSIKLDFWHNQPQKIFSKKDFREKEMLNKTEQKLKKELVPADRRRFEFLNNQPDVLFGFYGENGFNDYRGFIFDSCILFENAECQNAAFRINFSKISEKEKKQVFSDTGRDRLLEKYWKPHEKKSKGELRSDGCERIIHRPIDSWIPQMQELLNEKNPLPNRNVKLSKQRIS